MVAVHPHYITDTTGEKLSVVLPIEEFINIMEELDELEDIRLYDESKEDNESSVPIDEAFKIIEAKRNQK